MNNNNNRSRSVQSHHSAEQNDKLSPGKKHNNNKSSERKSKKSSAIKLESPKDNAKKRGTTQYDSIFFFENIDQSKPHTPKQLPALAVLTKMISND